MKVDLNVALPEVAETAFVRIDVPALEALEEYFGAKYHDIILAGLDGFRISVTKKILEISLHNASVEQVFETLDPETICARLLDALMRVWRDKTLAQLTGKE